MTKTAIRKTVALLTLVGLIALVALLRPTSADAAPPRLADGGFERAVSWTAYGKGYEADTRSPHSGMQSLRCVNTGGGETRGAFISVSLNQSRALPIRLSGWSRAVAIDGVADNDYAIYVDLTYTDGSSLWGQTAPFETGSHPWQRQQLTIFPGRAVRSLTLYALFRNHTGTAWFDDFDVREVTSDHLFDSQELAPPRLPRGRSGGWYVRDVALGGPLVPISPGKTALGLRLMIPGAGTGKVLRGTLRNSTAHSRAITLYYAERFEEAQPVWWNSIRDGVPAVETREYADLTQAGAGATGQLSRYPFGCVTGRGTGRALGLPPDLGPRVARIAFRPDSRLLFLACDLALTPAGDPAGHDRAPVGVARWAVNPAWGFRDAAAGYYALFPGAFRRRAKAEGIWMPFTDPAKVENVADFHVAYHEGDNSVAGDRAKGILSFRYIEPMTYWMPMEKSVPRTYRAALAEVQRLASGGDPVTAHSAQAVLSSGSQDTLGRFNVAFRDTPWCDGAVWVLNPGPYLGKGQNLWTRARINRAAAPVPGKASSPDGLYLDSLEAWADVLDYRPESLRATSLPLCFAPGRFRPALPTWFSVYESAADLSHSLHAHNQLLMANSVPWRFSAFAPLLDVMGTETNMFTETGAWSPESDSVMTLRRTLSYHKPYLLLLNADFTKVSGEGIERYFARCTFYGIYPSMFSANAADHPYWEDPALYNRDRPLFQKYIPVLQRLSAAGWEPVTEARSDSPHVWVERFGKNYLTVLNAGEGPVTTTLRINTARLFPRTARGRARFAVHDLLTGKNLGTAPLGSAAPLTLTLAGQQTCVLFLSQAASETPK